MHADMISFPSSTASDAISERSVSDMTLMHFMPYRWKSCSFIFQQLHQPATRIRRISVVEALQMQYCQRASAENDR